MDHGARSRRRRRILTAVTHAEHWQVRDLRHPRIAVATRASRST